MINTRHYAVVGYCGITALAIFKDIITTVEGFTIAAAPIAAAFAYDKITALRKTKTS